jgi:hypothetical protein
MKFWIGFLAVFGVIAGFFLWFASYCEQLHARECTERWAHNYGAKYEPQTTGNVCLVRTKDGRYIPEKNIKETTQ